MEVQCFALGPVAANSYILTDEKSGEAAVIYCGDCTPEFLEALEGRELKYILLTHGHADHILGVYGLKQRFPRAGVAIHYLEARALEDEKYSLGDEIAPGEQRPVKADITLSDGDELKLGESVIRVMHTPGHTAGGVCYLLEKERMIFTGDTLFSLTVGRTDLGGDPYDLYRSVKMLAGLDGDYRIFPGHNRSTTLDYERRRNRFMRRFK